MPVFILSKSLQRYFWLTVIMFFCLGGNAQNGRNNSFNAHASGLGNAFATVSGTQAIGNNPAGISTIESFSLVLSSEQRFLLSDLTGAFVGIGISADRLGTFQLSYAQFGFEAYQERSGRFGYGRSLAKNWAAGLSLNWWQLSIENFGQRSLFNFNLGSQLQVSEDIRLGIFIAHPMATDVSETTELESELRFGVQYAANKKLQVLMDISKVIDRAERIHLGINYQWHPNFALKLGYASNPGIFSFGLGISLGTNLSIIGASQYHEQLGQSPSFTLAYEK